VIEESALLRNGAPKLGIVIASGDEKASTIVLLTNAPPLEMNAMLVRVLLAIAGAQAIASHAQATTALRGRLGAAAICC
jgi:hypothetical protein